MVGYMPHREAFFRRGGEISFSDVSKLAPQVGEILAEVAPACYATSVRDPWLSHGIFYHQEVLLKRFTLGDCPTARDGLREPRGLSCSSGNTVRKASAGGV